MDPALLRSLERILAVAIGGMSIVLGYRLFLALPEHRDSSGTVKLPWSISIVLARVGPGIFFALFGAAVVAFGLYSAVTVKTERTETGGSKSETMSMSGIGLGATGSDETLGVRRLRVEAEIRFLNSLPIPEASRQGSSDEINAIKFALMATAWDPGWGDPAQFKDWVDSGALEPTPAGLQPGAEFFRRRSSP
jgi:hypothetical protein